MPRVAPRTRQSSAGRTGPRSGARSGPRLFCVLAATLALAAHAPAQQSNPVFVDDSTLAADILSGLPGLVASGNQAEAVRLIQRLLDEEGERLVASEGDPDLFESVRDRVHRLLLTDADLLERYRRTQTPSAAFSLEQGRVEAVERSQLLTRPGFEAAVRVAAEHLGSGRFESARLTINQLERHPDAAEPTLAAQATDILVNVASYLDRADVRDRAAAWAARAGTEAPPIEPVRWPAELTEPVHSPRQPGGSLDADTLVGTPLRSVDLRPVGMAEPEADQRLSRRGRPAPEFPYMFPLVVGDTIYTTDGLWVSAWDRYTLAERWRIKPRGADNEREALEETYAVQPYRQRQSRDVEEATVLSASGRILLVATGIVTDGSRTGDPRLHAFDRETGRLLWSSYIDELAPQLAEATSRGPAVFEGDLAVIAVRKVPQAKRFASAYLVGIDLADGAARWVRLSGSAGWLSYGGRGRWTDWPAIHEGVVYRVDELGVICAVEAGSGRTRWVRRLSGVESRMPMQRLPWTASQPIIAGNSMLTLSPDRRSLLEIDLADGRVTGTRPATDFDRPAYIFPHDDDLIAVGEARVAAVRLDQAITGAVRLSPRVPDPGILGRVSTAGEALLLPVPDGFGIVLPSALGEARPVALDEGGNMIALNDQLLTIDNTRLHSYLVWDRAAEDLRDRLANTPSDVSTAVTFAELAYRAGRPDEVIAPADATLNAMAISPLSPDVEPARERLFGLLLEMLRDTLTTDGPAMAVPLRDEIVKRLGAVSRTADQRAAHLLMRARVGEAAGRFADALADYQAVVADASLADASWKRGASEVRARLEAFDRIDGLLAARGPTLYAPLDREAAESLARLREAQARPQAFADLARLFPRASVTPGAWLESAEGWRARGAGLAAEDALARGLDAALTSHALGLPVDPQAAGELAGRRLRSLLEADRLAAAQSVLQSLEEGWPELTITHRREPLERAALALTIRERSLARTSRPVVGLEITGEPVSLDGWVLMRPIDRRDAHARREGAMLLAADRVALWTYGDGPSRRWSYNWSRKPTLLRHDPGAVILYEPGEEGGTIFALAESDGSVLWRSESIAVALSRAEGGGRPVIGREQFEAPLDGLVNAGDLLLAFDEGVIAVISRSGRAIGIDLETGRTGWAKRTSCQAVHDAAAGGGVLALAGLGIPEQAHEAGEQVVTLLDLADGRELSRYTPAAGRVLWVQIAPAEHRAVVGTSQGLVGLSIPDARLDWTMDDPMVSDTSGGWIFDDSLFLITPVQELGLVDIRAGRLIEHQLDTRGRLDRGGPIDIVAGGGRLIVMGPAGAAVLDARTGELLGADAVQQFDRLVQPVLGEGVMVIFERDPVAGAPGVFRFHLLDAASGRALAQRTLRLADPPTRAALLDGAILVTSGDRTVVIPAGGSDI